MQVLQGKIIFITGAASGIGAETARQLSVRGAIPIITGRNEKKLKDTAASLRGAYGCYKMDVRDQDEVSEVIGRAASDFGRIDVLLNNAGYGLFESFEEAPLSHFSEMMDTNYMGIVRCTKTILPIMRNQGGGHIVNVASMAGKLSTAKSSGYAATKHAVLGLTNALRIELKPLGIAVSAVNPGPIDTPFLLAADPEGTYANNVRGYMLKPDKVAEAIVRVIERRTPEVDLPWSAGIGIRLYGMAPRFADKVAGRFLNRK
ncbi:SDR family NAD(P)-dependent oxidoreductase [Paenibacillus mendelii]|uniref:SDR family NAD(P)-dependent oxidoreductase n=1 Tax=Paenibacillus mendelii TaxID=206163 RepID=A0ABV6JA22_9BACL|nr:SDR family oxidoreductase [Paenibacillus mendelii]MCQ6559662.1 SDR family oxidoreductase [Paenibacillus mendelii]